MPENLKFARQFLAANDKDPVFQQFGEILDVRERVFNIVTAESVDKSEFEKTLGGMSSKHLKYLPSPSPSAYTFWSDIDGVLKEVLSATSKDELDEHITKVKEAKSNLSTMLAFMDKIMSDIKSTNNIRVARAQRVAAAAAKSQEKAKEKDARAVAKAAAKEAKAAHSKVALDAIRSPRSISAVGIMHMEPSKYAKRIRVVDAMEMPVDPDGTRPLLITNVQSLNDFFGGAAVRESFQLFKQDR